MQVLTPIDDLKYDISWINIIVTISSNLFQDDFYEGAITPGQKFGLFTSTDTTITSKSDFSAYFSHTFSIDQIDEEDKEDYKYYDKFFEYRRALVSTDANGNAYSFPENTKITMLDMVTNKYYYYIVTADDVVQNKYVYYLEDFIIMGSENGQYNEIEESKNYYLQDQNTYYENFIFHVSFADTNIEQNVVNNSLLMELRNTEGQTLVSVIGIQRDVLKYSVYPNQDATIDVEGEVIPETIYLPAYTLSPEQIFRGNILLFNVDFFGVGRPTEIKEATKDGNIAYYYYEDKNGQNLDTNGDGTYDTTGYKTSKQDIAVDLGETISKWYVSIRNIALVVMMIVLLYIGIRMLLSTLASDKAKYRQMIQNFIR